MIDSDGFRPNVGIILTNQKGQLFWGRRVGQNAWQFPQGGIKAKETPLQALYRELRAYLAIPEHLFQQTVSDQLAEWTARYGILTTYASLDHAYRTGEWAYRAPREDSPSVWRAAAGLVGYYLLKLPYAAYKAWAEWHG